MGAGHYLALSCTLSGEPLEVEALPESGSSSGSIDGDKVSYSTAHCGAASSLVGPRVW